MENRRYDYVPITRREVIRWPGDTHLAILICPNVEYFHIDKPLPFSGSAGVPDIPGYTLRDYGSRIGFYRMTKVFDRYGIRASVLLNSDVCGHHPEIIEEGTKRGWEWLGHGVTNNLRLTSYPEDTERDIIRQVRDTISAAVGQAPKGWLGPGGGVETFNTPDHLAAEGFEYLLDWGCDDQPIPFRVRSGRMIAIPYQQGINDIQELLFANRTPEQWFGMVRDQFNTLYEEGKESGRVMTLPFHPFVIGLPYRIPYLDKVLEYICSHQGVWLATGWEVAQWFYEHYYQDPGPLPEE